MKYRVFFPKPPIVPLAALALVFTLRCTNTLVPSAPAGSEPSGRSVIGPGDGVGPVPPVEPVEPASADTSMIRPEQLPPAARPDTTRRGGGR